MSPPTAIGEPAPVLATLRLVLRSVQVARNDVIGLPLPDPGVNATFTAPSEPVALPDTARTPIGALGAERGMTAADAGEGGLVPTLLVAVTVQV